MSIICISAIIQNGSYIGKARWEGELQEISNQVEMLLMATGFGDRDIAVTHKLLKKLVKSTPPKMQAIVCYIRDDDAMRLEAREFKVLKDNVEQTIDDVFARFDPANKIH